MNRELGLSRFCLGLLIAITLSAVMGRSAETISADAAWTELQPLVADPYPEEIRALPSRQQRYEWFEHQALQLRERGLAFLTQFPQDPRRWSAAWAMINRAPRFVRSYGPNYEKDYKDVVIDEASVATWKMKLGELEQALQQATDLPADVREALDTRAIYKAFGPAFEAASKGQSVSWDAATESVLKFLTKYPAGEGAARVATGFMYFYETAHTPAESAAQWRKFTDSPHTKVAEVARGKLKALDAISGPVDLAFTALDGREVDTRKLRGKVVLIDFWATWCGPCLAEMPNVKKVYAAYHDKGFEIIGISCDVSPEYSKQAIARTGTQVLEFCQKNDMPWPQHYEGKKHNAGGNSLAERFAVTGIPAAFLLDQNGYVVGLNLRGEKLETEVKRLLKL